MTTAATFVILFIAFGICFYLGVVYERYGVEWEKALEARWLRWWDPPEPTRCANGRTRHYFKGERSCQRCGSPNPVFVRNARAEAKTADAIVDLVNMSDAPVRLSR